jgi:hypothetical protein
MLPFAAGSKYQGAAGRNGKETKDKPMAERLPPVMDLFKLVDACNRCSAVFRVADERLQDVTFRDFHDKLQKTLDRFVFELKKENTRIGNRSEPREPGALEIRCVNVSSPLTQAGTELQSTVNGYDTLLARPMPPHARAMVQRQRQSLGQLLADLDQLSKVGSA